jgi:hypothetical protein
MMQTNLKESQMRDHDSTVAPLELLAYMPLAIKQASAKRRRACRPFGTFTIVEPAISG